jgi:hypothetical protein
MEMSQIVKCNVSTCVFNRGNSCHILGITVGPHGECNTSFNHANASGGFDEVKGGVGACLATHCKFNDRFVCKAQGIGVTVHDRHADCETFQPRK